VDVLSREEIDRLEDSARTERDKLIVRILADTGIRVVELIKLRTTDLIERDRAMRVRRPSCNSRSERPAEGSRYPPRDKGGADESQLH